ncbi:MAG: GNAT family N-acetyltransferase [Solirubrobacterales bacterium]
MTPSLPVDTERLRFRAVTMDDVDEFLALHEDPLVARFMGTYDRDGMVEWMRKGLDEWAARGHGRVAILDRGSGEFIGRTGLKHWPQFGETEVGWVLRPEVRGRGLATEAGAAALRWGFEQFDLPYITAMIQPENTASVRVAERLGLSPQRTDTLLGEQVVVHAISREEWESLT